MFEIQPDFETPPDEARIWRYLDVGRFLALIQSKTLYFALKRELEDPWEGAHPAVLTQRIAAAFNPPASGQIVQLFRLAAEQAVFNCWHENDHESVAMWSLYTTGREGVAIQSTIGRLKQAFQSEPSKIIIARVHYVDYIQSEDQTQNTARVSNVFNALEPLVCKRASFSHEREVRALIPFPNEAILRKQTGRLKPELGDVLTFPPRTEGMSIAVDPATLIEKIVASPTYPRWAMGALQEVVERCGLPLAIQLSDLIKTPEDNLLTEQG